MSATLNIVPVVDQTLVEAYANGDQKIKARIRADLTKASLAAVATLDMQAMVDAQSTLAALAPANRPARVQIDPRTVVAQRVADLRRAADLIEAGHVVPTDLNWTPADQPLTDEWAVEADDETARKIAGTKITRTDLRRSIDAVFDRAFDGLDSGTFLTVSQIAKRGAIEGYAPSDGAVAARLWPTDKDGNSREVTLDERYVPTAANGKTARGATLADD